MNYKDFVEKLKNYIRHNLLLLIKRNLHAQHNIKLKSTRNMNDLQKQH